MRRTPRRAAERPAVPDRNEPRINHRIRVPRVLVIDEEGNKLGEFMTEDAVALAEERGLDLVEVAPEGRPPVCRIADFGKLKYEKKKREMAARKNQVQVQLKEVKLRPKTDVHDLQVKIRHCRSFLEDGNKVRVTVRFRGREIAHRDIGAERCLHVAEFCKDLSMIESPPRMDGRQMFMVLAPTKKPVPKHLKTEKVDDLPALDDDDDDDDDDTTGEEPPTGTPTAT